MPFFNIFVEFFLTKISIMNISDSIIFDWFKYSYLCKIYEPICLQGVQEFFELFWISFDWCTESFLQRILSDDSSSFHSDSNHISSDKNWSSSLRFQDSSFTNESCTLSSKQRFIGFWSIWNSGSSACSFKRSRSRHIFVENISIIKNYY